MLAFCLITAMQAQTVFDFEDQTIPTNVGEFTNDATYPWTVENVTPGDAGNTSSYCIKSGNSGEHSSTSAIELTYTFSTDGYISFDALCMGEGSNTAWDKCEFYIDDEVQFSYGAGVTGWHKYNYNVTAGEHTFTWKYTKDSFVNPTGDAFFVDNINYGNGCVIFKINIEGFSKPVWGTHPDYEVNVPADANYTLDNVDWNWRDAGNNDGAILGESETFNNEDYVYFMYFKVLPNNGCTFADNVTFTVNGETNIIDTIDYDDNFGVYWAYTKDYTVEDLHSLANWYGFNMAGNTLENHFITFSMQDFSTVDAAASSTVGTINAACYADGYMWCFTQSTSDLVKAFVNNTNHTIEDFETVASNFLSNSRIALAMSYNPSDGKIYAITTDGYSEYFYLISFDPSDPVGTLSEEIQLNFQTILFAINNEGEAYSIGFTSGILYRLDLSNGSTTVIGNTGLSINYWQSMAFDMVTGELFWAEISSNGEYGMYKVNPANASTTYLGQVANGDVKGISGLFMVPDEQPLACLSPSHLNATPAITTATVSWTEKGEATQWVVAYKADGETNFTEITVDETNYTLTELTLETHYTVKVRPVCEDGSLKWSGVSFTTHGLCDNPSGLEASNVTVNSATLEWTGYLENYNVRVRSVDLDTVFFEDFENGLPDTWTTIDADGDGYYWTYYSGTELSTHSGVGIVYSESYNVINSSALTPDNWLITPQINLNGTMKVWLRGDYDSERFAIYLSTSGNSVDDFIELVPETTATDKYVEYTADLSEYAGLQGYIAIRHFNVTDALYLNLDDFGVFLDDDWTTVTASGNSVNLADLELETTYQVQVQGICEDGVTEWSEVLEFTTYGLCDDPSGLEASNVTGNSATLEWTGYQDNYNIRYVMPAEIDTILFEDFENGLPAAWTTIDNDGDGYNWTYYSGTGLSTHSGVGIVYSESYFNPYPLTPDNWLITPQINLNGTLKVWLKAQDGDYLDHFAIYLSTTGNTVDDFTTLVPETVATGGYVEYTADLSAYAGQQGYIAIRHFNSSDMYRLNVDDFGVFLEPWTTVTASGNSTELTGLDPETTYQVQVQGVCEDGVTAWSEVLEFTTTEEIVPDEPDEPDVPVEPVPCDPTTDCDGHSYPTVRIGDVCWMQKNLAAVSCVTSGNVYAYVNDQFPDEAANVATFGRLYDEAAVMQGIGGGAKAGGSTGICPTGYRLPTVAEIEALGAAYTADELKSDNLWISGGGSASDLSGFSWLPGGCYSSGSNQFQQMLLEGYLWATEEVGGVVSPAMYKLTYYCSTILMRVENHTGLSASVRCVKDQSFTCGTDKMKDANGNEYETVEIGTQCWTKTNLRATKKADGSNLVDPIAAGITPTYSTTEPYYYNYSSYSLPLETRGYLYNWEAAKLVCPAGWHLPSDAEWTAMEATQTSMDLTGSGWRGDHAGRLAGDGWNPSSTAGAPGDASDPNHNVSGFAAVPAGGCHGGSFNLAGRETYFWSSMEYGTGGAWARFLDYDDPSVDRGYVSREFGYSVRCLRN